MTVKNMMEMPEIVKFLMTKGWISWLGRIQGRVTITLQKIVGPRFQDWPAPVLEITFFSGEELGEVKEVRFGTVITTVPDYQSGLKSREVFVPNDYTIVDGIRSTIKM